MGLALQSLLVEEGLVTTDAVDEAVLRGRTLALECGDRDAHEFVPGDPHTHADELPEGHTDGADHRGHSHTH